MIAGPSFAGNGTADSPQKVDPGGSADNDIHRLVRVTAF
jgi:hypothetical protein